MASNRGYEDILEPRRKEYSNFLYTGRAINAQIAFKQNIKPTPQSHKEDVVKSVKIQQLLTKVREICCYLLNSKFVFFLFLAKSSQRNSKKRPRKASMPSFG